MENSPSPSPSPPRAPLGERLKESYKSYALPGFAFGSVLRFMHDRLLNRRAPGRVRAEAALRTGMTGAFRTPIFICMERSLAARRGQSDWVSFWGAVLGSCFPTWVFTRIQLGGGLRFRVGGIPYWLFLLWLMPDHKESLMSPEEV